MRTRSEGMQSMPHQGPWQAEGFAHPLDDAGLVYEVYLAREGRDLPPA